MKWLPIIEAEIKKDMDAMAQKKLDFFKELDELNKICGGNPLCMGMINKTRMDNQKRLNEK